MLLDIFRFLLDLAVGLLAGACLLRLYMQAQRVPFGNPVGRFVFALTDWMVLPLRRVLPALGRWDSSSLAAAFLLECAQYALLWALSGAAGSPSVVLLAALLGMVRLVLSLLMGLMLVYAVLSWVRIASPVGDVIERLCAPLLRPLRRVIPLVGGIDLSPLVFLVAVQVAQMVLVGIQHTMLR